MTENSEWDTLLGAFNSKATVQTIDFTNVPLPMVKKSGITRDAVPRAPHPRSADGKSLTKKQIRARARRARKRGQTRLTPQEFETLYKPLEEWDLDELAKGRPRGPNGTFSGPKPAWITREVHEKSTQLFAEQIKQNMNMKTVGALEMLQRVMNNDDVDDKGKPVVPANVRVDIAKFLLEHVVGKPTQRVENDISVKLQHMLGVVMANPAEAFQNQVHGGQGYSPGHMPGLTMPMGIPGQADWDDDSDLDEGGE